MLGAEPAEHVLEAGDVGMQADDVRERVATISHQPLDVAAERVSTSCHEIVDRLCRLPAFVVDADFASGRSRREALVAMSRDLYRRGWMEGTSGNVSMRCEAGVVLITASGRCQGCLRDDDAVRVRLDDGAPLDPSSPPPSAESCIHLALYRCLPGRGGVGRAHPPDAAALATRLRSDDDIVQARDRLERLEALCQPQLLTAG